MSRKLYRREFTLGAFYLGAACLIGAGERPRPHVYRLSQWRSLKGFEKLESAFQFLTADAIATKAPGRYAIDGDRVYATIVEDVTRSPETAQFEAHRKYIDLHYLISGHELIGTAPATDLHEIKPYSSETEAALYERPEKYRKLILKPGEFTVFFPGQAHMPGCYPDTSAQIKKVVVKVLS